MVIWGSPTILDKRLCFWLKPGSLSPVSQWFVSSSSMCQEHLKPTNISTVELELASVGWIPPPCHGFISVYTSHQMQHFRGGFPSFCTLGGGELPPHTQELIIQNPIHPRPKSPRCQDPSSVWVKKAGFKVDNPWTYNIHIVYLHIYTWFGSTPPPPHHDAGASLLGWHEPVSVLGSGIQT